MQPRWWMNYRSRQMASVSCAEGVQYVYCELKDVFGTIQVVIVECFVRYRGDTVMKAMFRMIGFLTRSWNVFIARRTTPNDRWWLKRGGMHVYPYIQRWEKEFYRIFFIFKINGARQKINLTISKIVNVLDKQQLIE